MTLPLYTQDGIGYEMALFLYTLVGVGFGFALERAGFGYAPNLAAQFYGTDTRVLKVMFTAIATACVGIVALAAIGVVDLGAVQIPETWLWPQLVGGLLLGVGFILSGYCPGTAVVAMSSGKQDGLFTLIGAGIGSLLYGLLAPAIEPFANSGHLGVVRIGDLLGVSDPVLALAVVGMATGAFLLGEHAERFFSGRRGLEAPAFPARVRNAVLGSLGGVAALALVFSLVGVGSTSSEAPSRAPRAIAPETLASGLIERPWAFWVLDLRDPAACEKERIPGAVCRPQDPAAFIRGLPTTRILVLYGQGDLPGTEEVASAYGGEVAILAGGYEAFSARFAAPPDEALARSDPDTYRLRSAVHSWLTRASSAPPPPAPSPKAPQRPPRKGGGC